MPSIPDQDGAAERDAKIARLIAACEVLTQLLTKAGVSPAGLLECLYDAAEDDLLILMRLAAALDPQQRAQAETMLRTLIGAGQTASS